MSEPSLSSSPPPEEDSVASEESVTSPEPADAVPVSFGRTLLQFFVIPMAVVALGVGIFLGFAWLVSDDATPQDFLQQIRAGGAHQKRQAAFELANRIQHGDPEDFAALGPELARTFDDFEGSPDAFVRQYLALALGALAEPSAAASLVGALEDPDETVRVYAAWALGAIGGTLAVEALAAASRAEDAGVRTMAVYGLGAIGDAGGTEALRRAVEDPVLDVRVNAVVALARIGDPGAEEQLLGMLEPAWWDTVPGMLPGERTLGRLSAVQAAGILNSPAVREQLARVGAEDPNLRVREAALSALDREPGAPTAPAPR